MATNTSQHILNTSATLLGFCLFVITSLHVADKVETHLIDELTSVVSVLLTLSCFFSFTSIRSTRANRAKRMETTADYLFISALIGIVIIILLITMNILE